MTPGLDGRDECEGFQLLLVQVKGVIRCSIVKRFVIKLASIARR